MECDPICPLLPGPGQCGSDRELFARVWRRVMPADLTGCPIVPDDVEAPDQAAPLGPEVPTVSCAAPAVPETAALPAPEPPPRRSEPSSDRTALLQRLIRDALSGARLYTDLARQADRAAAPALRAAADDNLRHARRLSTACFLFSGVYYWPAEMINPRSEAPFPAALRARFLAEQGEKSACHMAAATAADPRMRLLFLDLAREKGAHIELILDLLEQL